MAMGEGQRSQQRWWQEEPESDRPRSAPQEFQSSVLRNSGDGTSHDGNGGDGETHVDDVLVVVWGFGY